MTIQLNTHRVAGNHIARGGLASTHGIPGSTRDGDAHLLVSHRLHSRQIRANQVPPHRVATGARAADVNTVTLVSRNHILLLGCRSTHDIRGSVND